MKDAAGVPYMTRPCVSTIQRVMAAAIRPVFAAASGLLARLRPDWHPRRWSNAELRRVARLFEGDIINVSGWDDRDKEGGRYADYFPNKRSYRISNIGGARGASGREDEIYLDLSLPLPEELRGRFDVVFNHTTLEHIYDIRAALANLCGLSRDVVITVAPFMQAMHWDEGSYLDFWRPTPFALEHMFEENGFRALYMSWNDNPVYPVYLFCVASRNPERWEGKFPPLRRPDARRFPCGAI
ncbi:MAG: hypothetical protein N3A38_02180 [Planctomycetota bacterium]|nr:hypothetical protein [Planctomycetota bacterium]